ncbi:hypothetical protein L7F22_059933 [Adiantum nelumboides]|nr:hypothetical protein [Adiantum nelumboides]
MGKGGHAPLEDVNITFHFICSRRYATWRRKEERGEDFFLCAQAFRVGWSRRCRRFAACEAKEGLVLRQGRVFAYYAGIACGDAAGTPPTQGREGWAGNRGYCERPPRPVPLFLGKAETALPCSAKSSKSGHMTWWLLVCFVRPVRCGRGCKGLWGVGFASSELAVGLWGTGCMGC